MSKTHNFSKYKIYYEDTDAGGIVYYANYLKFCERARTDFIQQKNIPQLMEAENLIFVVRNCEIDYLAPERRYDEIEVSGIIEKIGSASITLLQEIKKNGLVLSSAKVIIVCISLNDFKPKKMPENIKNLLNVR